MGRNFLGERVIVLLIMLFYKLGELGKEWEVVF